MICCNKLKSFYYRWLAKPLVKSLNVVNLTVKSGMDLKRTTWKSWTQRDIEILESLATKIRVLSLEQIAKNWWGGSKNPVADARKRISKLRKAGLIIRYQINTHPMLQLEKPVISWFPNHDLPDFSSVAWRLKQRWTLPHYPTWIFIASKSTANLFASNSGTLKDPAQVTHDLHLAEVYLKCRKTRPRLARAWVGEDAFGKAGYGIKDPDAFIMNSNGDAIHIIEFGGKYSSDRIRDFHEHCAQRSLGYELW